MDIQFINFNCGELQFMAGETAGLDTSGLTSILTVSAFQGIITSVFPIVGTAVLVGFVFYTVRWAIGLFRGI